MGLLAADSIKTIFSQLQSDSLTICSLVNASFRSRHILEQDLLPRFVIFHVRQGRSRCSERGRESGRILRCASIFHTAAPSRNFRMHFPELFVFFQCRLVLGIRVFICVDVRCLTELCIAAFDMSSRQHHMGRLLVCSKTW